MATQPLPNPIVRMPRGSALSASHPVAKAADGRGHLHGRLASLTALALATAAAAVVTALMRVAL